jgi:hypothetical protein
MGMQSPGAVAPKPIADPTVAAGISAPTGPHWPELDLFRSLACGCMILNHLAVQSLGVGRFAIISKSEFIGSFAPVLFFFATGLGYGFQSAKPGEKNGFGFLLKVGILLIADLDFFMFIGMSMLILEFIRRMAHGAMIATGIGGSMILIRFIAGPLFRASIEQHAWKPWIGDLVGTGGNFGYPLGPWLAFPMLGYAIGRISATNREAFQNWRRLPEVLVGLAVPFAIGSLVLTARGFPPFRYGVMNASYFFASVAAISTSLALVIWLSRRPWLSIFCKRVSLNGLRSFAVVPLHYFLLALTKATLGVADRPWSFVAILVVILVLSFSTSALFIRIAALLDHPFIRTLTLSVIFLETLIYYTTLRGVYNGLASIAILSVFQLSLCIVLSFRVKNGGRGRSQPAPSLFLNKLESQA